MLRVPYAEDTQVDALTKLTSTQALGEGWPFVETLLTWIIEENGIFVIEEELSWIDEILYYKRDEMLSIDPMAAWRVKHPSIVLHN